jgi:hypothetical protein
MTDDDDDEDEEIRNFLEARERALAFHEAGHTVVAYALGAEVCFIEANFATLAGLSKSSVFVDNIENLAVCVAGCRAEHAFGASSRRATKKGDLRDMRKLLSLFPEPDRRVARSKGYRMADVTIEANADESRIAHELLARRQLDADPKVRIEGAELAALLAGTGQLR